MTLNGNYYFASCLLTLIVSVLHCLLHFVVYTLCSYLHLISWVYCIPTCRYINHCIYLPRIELDAQSRTTTLHNYTYHNFFVQVHSHLPVSDPCQTTASYYGTPPDCQCKILLPSLHSSIPQICTLLPSTKLFISFQGQLMTVISSSLLLMQPLTQVLCLFQAKCRQTGMATMFLIPLWGMDISNLPLHSNFLHQAITMFL